MIFRKGDLVMLDKYSEEQLIINEQASNKTEISRLAHLIYNHSPKDGTFSQSIPGLHTRRYSKIDKDWVKSFYFPSVLIVVQGAKAVRIGKETFQIGKGCMLMIPVGVPVALKTIQASYKEPFLGIGLTLEPEKIAEFVQKVLRLQEARHLMLSKKMDAATACQLVGYASASQFSRDYSNYFGNPPRKDIDILYKQLKKSDESHDIK